MLAIPITRGRVVILESPVELTRRDLQFVRKYLDTFEEVLVVEEGRDAAGSA